MAIGCRPDGSIGTGVTPSQEAAITANTTARHTHANKATLDDSTAAYTSAEKTKLGNMTDSFKGVYANQTAIQAAHPTPVAGWCAWNTATSTIWSVVSGAWANSGISSIGDMLKAVYDPQSIAGDAFSRAKHTGAQAISTVTGLQTALDSRVVNGQSAAVAFAGTLGADGFCRLGSTGPSIKMKKLTGVLNGVGAHTDITHGLTLSKIISFTGVVINSGGRMVDMGSTYDADSTFQGNILDLVIRLRNDGANLVGKTATILLMYEA